ncbi:MAG: hypothetical protein ACHQC8_06535 [Solirubrobacterales bacterium]
MSNPEADTKPELPDAPSMPPAATRTTQSVAPPARLVWAGLAVILACVGGDIALTLAHQPIPSLLPTAGGAAVALLFGRSLLKMQP